MTRRDATATANHLQAVVEASPLAIVAVDRAGRVTRWNERAEQLFGYSSASVIGKPAPHLPDVEGTSAVSELEAVLEGASLDGVEVRRRTRDGDLVECELWAAPIRTDGAVVGATSTYVDATGRNAHQQELERYRRRLEGAMLAGNLAWWEMDVESGAVQFQNQKATMLGYDPQSFSHYEDFVGLLHPDDESRAMEAMRRHLEGTADRYDVEYRIRTATDEYRWLHDIGGVSERTADGAPAKVTGIVIDVSDRKERTAELERQREQFALLSQLVRHDIRNEMGIVLGWLDVLRLDEADEPDVLRKIVEACKQVVELTQSSGDLVTVIGEGANVHVESVSLWKILRNQVEQASAAFEDATFVYDAGASSACSVQANSLLTSVFRNLLYNAVYHNDSETPRIEVTVEEREETVVVRVADNGPGIPSDQQAQLFGKGSKGLDSEGTGIGLYLVRSLVDAYGGSVDVVDNEPRGAVFVVELMRAEGTSK